MLRLHRAMNIALVGLLVLLQAYGAPFCGPNCQGEECQPKAESQPMKADHSCCPQESANQEKGCECPQVKSAEQTVILNADQKVDIQTLHDWALAMPMGLDLPAQPLLESRSKAPPTAHSPPGRSPSSAIRDRAPPAA